MPVGRRTIGPASSGLGWVWPAGISLSHCALAAPVAGRAQCTLTSLPGVQCFLRHIGVAGLQVGCAFCEEAVRLGWVVFRRMHGSIKCTYTYNNHVEVTQVEIKAPAVRTSACEQIVQC
jgi:hypothetical protein